jgi:hypothetical protein
MSRYFSFFVLALATFSMILTGAVTAHAGGFDTGMVVTTNANPSLNVRDANCNKVGTLPYNTGFIIQSTGTTCQINGTTHFMVGVADNKFVSSNFLTYTGERSSGTNNFLAINFATATTKLNIRDANCKKIGSVASGAKLTLTVPSSEITCTIEGVTYQMTSILSNNHSYFVAKKFLKM